VPLDSKAALVVIDVQQGFDDPRWGPRNNPDAERTIAHLLGHWRAARRPVIHVRHDSRTPGSSLHPDHLGNAFKPRVRPLDGEAVYPKVVNSAFIGTSLERDLREQGILTLAIVGLTTNHCVSTTVRMAGNLGFQTFVVSDATATFDRIGLDGKVRAAAEVHASALSDLHEEFATVIDSGRLLAGFGASGRALDESPGSHEITGTRSSGDL
jgi:nicotinamidase-related amidase